MIFLFLALLLFSNEGWTASEHLLGGGGTIVEHDTILPHSRDVIIDHDTTVAHPPFPQPPARIIHYGSAQETPRPQISGLSEDYMGEKKRTEDYNPKHHPVLSRSTAAKRYIECSTICCFFSRGWFKTGSFLCSVATTGIAGLAYGVSDVDLKNKLNLSLLILTVATAALRKFETYANAEIKDDENEYGMFLPETTEHKETAEQKV